MVRSSYSGGLCGSQLAAKLRCCGSLERAKYCNCVYEFRREGLFQVFLCSSLAFEINLNFSVSAKMNDIEK